MADNFVDLLGRDGDLVVFADATEQLLTMFAGALAMNHIT